MGIMNDIKDRTNWFIRRDRAMEDEENKNEERLKQQALDAEARDKDYFLFMLKGNLKSIWFRRLIVEIINEDKRITKENKKKQKKIKKIQKKQKRNLRRQIKKVRV